MQGKEIKREKKDLKRLGGGGLSECLRNDRNAQYIPLNIRDVDPVLTKKTGSRALYLKQRDIFKIF